MKSHSAPLKGTHGVNKAACALNTQSDLKAAELNQICHKEFMDNNKTWSESITARHTGNFGEGLIKEEYNRESFYRGKYVGDMEFEVTYVGDSTGREQGSRQIEEDGCDDFPDAPVPVFSRVRTVTIDTDGVMRCSCCKFNTSGYFCVHCIVVARLVCKEQGETFLGFTHNDIIPRYRNDFMYLAYNKNAPPEIRMMFHRLAMEQVNGPTLNYKAPLCLKAEAKSRDLSAKERLKNYSSEDIDSSVVEGMHVSNFSPVGEDDKIMAQKLAEMAEKIKATTSVESTELFSKSLRNSSLPEASAKLASARSLLKSVVDESFSLANRGGQEAISDLENILEDFNGRWKKNIANNESAGKRKYFALSQESADRGSNGRVYNTKRHKL